MHGRWDQIVHCYPGHAVYWQIVIRCVSLSVAAPERQVQALKVLAEADAWVDPQAKASRLALVLARRWLVLKIVACVS